MLNRLFRWILESFLSWHLWLSSGKEAAELPDKIQTAIREQQDNSEKLIGWIQISVLLVFTILYLTVPNTLPDGVMFEPVPMFLGAYFLFTCMRLYLSYRISLPLWILVLSIVVDMALLMGLIWSFHIQYGQPASFYLKAPTLLYIFIFMALRALRFEPGYVLMCGFMGTLGWLSLVLFAMLSSTDTSMLTRDYVQYLTSNKILLGAEIDKVLVIMLVAVILTVGIARGRRLLIRSIVEGEYAQNLSHFVPASVAAQITQAEGPLIDAQTERREASILFIDLVSFTSLAEQLPAEQLIKTLNEYFSVISKPIERHHGVINQFHGDAILASFNLPSKDPDHACSAVTAALEIQETLHHYRFQDGIVLKTRAGINTGEVVGGFVGTPNHLSYTVYGDDVNIAARLQELSKEHGTSNLISLRTRQLCRSDKLRFITKGEEAIRGRQATVEVYEARFKHGKF